MRRLDPLRRTPWSAFPTVWLSMGWGRHRLGLSTARVVIGAGYHRSGLSPERAIIGVGYCWLGRLPARVTMDSVNHGLRLPRARKTASGTDDPPRLVRCTCSPTPETYWTSRYMPGL